MFESVREETEGTGALIPDANATASFFARQASFRPDSKPLHPTERRRNCIHVAKGMGTWTVVSLSNWSSKKVMLTVPPPALSPPPTHGWGDDVGSTDSGLDDDIHGYHVFGFWSSRYSWLASCGDDEYGDEDEEKRVDDFEHSVSKLLRPHETEVFHIKKVTPDTAQYIGTFHLANISSEILIHHSHCASLARRSTYRFRLSLFLWHGSAPVSYATKPGHHFPQQNLQARRLHFCFSSPSRPRSQGKSFREWT
jgi:hypothetical protein